MPKLVILGTSNAIPDEKHENTHLAFVGEEHSILVDCVNNPIVRLKQAGLDSGMVSDLILTHFHPDHVSGVPSLLMNAWLMGRERLMNIYGLSHAIDRLEALMGFYDWGTWPGFFPVALYRLPEREKASVLENGEFRVYSSLVCHLIPTIGLRVETMGTKKVAVYSCDTEPCESVIRLASGADVLVHEATGAYPGHTSAAQAGEVARAAGVKALYLIHYPVGEFDPEPLVDQARTTYDGPVALAEDFMEIEL